MPLKTDENPDALAHAKWALIADKIQEDPVLLEIPLSNISRWITKGQDALSMLYKWRDQIEQAQNSPAGLEELLTLLRSDDEHSRHLKSYSPFPGILTTEEVDQFTCAYRH